YPHYHSTDSSHRRQLLRQKATAEHDPYNHEYRKYPTRRDHLCGSFCIPTCSTVFPSEPIVSPFIHCGPTGKRPIKRGAVHIQKRGHISEGGRWTATGALIS